MYIQELFDYHTTDDFEETAIKTADFIVKNCQPWLSETNNGSMLAYRGMRGYDGINAFDEKVRLDRRPTDSSMEAQLIYNDFVETLGGVANRSNSIFVTGDYDQASGYGPIFVTFPVGQFNYTWSPEWRDYYRAVKGSSIQDMLYRDAKTKEERRAILEAGSEQRLQMFYKKYRNDKHFLNKLIKCDEDLRAALSDRREIMIACQSVVYVRYGFFDDYVSPLLEGQGI